MHNIAVIKSNMDVNGGGERVAANLCNDLSNKHSIILLEYYKNESVYALNSNIKRIFLTNKKKKKYFNLLYIPRLCGIFKHFNIDVAVIVGRSSFPILPIMAALFVRTKIIFFEQTTLEYKRYSKNNNIVKDIYHHFEQYIINNLSNKIVVLTTKERNNYLKKYGIAQEKIDVIHNYTDMKEIKTPYHVDAKRIISVGRLDYAKGYELLLQVAKIVFSRHPDWKWDIYGGGDEQYKKFIFDTIRKYNLTKNVELKGNCPNVYDVYANYSIFVFTSRYEGFGLVLLEAQKAHLPIVSFDIFSGPSEMIINEKNGYLISDYNVDEMANKICHLIQNKSCRESFSAHSCDKTYMFEKEYIIRKWILIIEKLLGE